MFDRYLLILGLLLTMFTRLTVAQPIQIGDRFEIKSHVLNENRAIQLLLPEGYHSNPEATYPVIYLLDGDYNFHGVSGVLDLLSNKGQLIPDVILVGIADKGTQRYREFMTPQGLAHNTQEDSGKAALFLRFINEEIKPYINKHFRTADNEMLIGHSIGGLFVLNTLLQSPESFDHYIAVSPAVWLHDHAFVKQAKDLVGKQQHDKVNLYLSLADEGRMGQYGFINLLDNAQPDNIRWQFTHYPDENHNSVGIISVRDSLKDLYQGWYLSDKALADMVSDKAKIADVVIAHYQKLKVRLGINQAIPTTSVQSIFRHLYRLKMSDNLDVLMARVKNELPRSEQAFILMRASYANHFDSAEKALNILLSEVNRFAGSIEYLKAIASKYEKLAQNDKAREYYQKAMKLAQKQQANQWQINIIEAKLNKIQVGN